MPNLFSKLFRRKNGDGEKDALVEQHANGGRTKGRKPSGRKTSPRKQSKRSAASASPTAVTEIAGNTANKDVSPTTSPTKVTTTPPRTFSPTGKNSATTSTTILHLSNPATAGGYEFAPSTASTSKTSDRDSPPVSGAEDGDAPRSSSKGRKTGIDTSQGSHRVVLSPRNAPASPTPRVNTGPVDLDDEDSEEEENTVRRHVTAVPLFTMDGTGPAPPHLLLNKPEEVPDDSSSFNLSTDAEDTEYENMKRGVAPASLDQSVASTYKSDGETSVFPNLVDEDPLTGDEKGYSAAWDPSSPIHDFPATTTSAANASTTSGNVSGFPSPLPPPTSASSFFKHSRKERQQAAKSSSPTTPASFKDDFANFADFTNFESQWPPNERGEKVKELAPGPSDGEGSPVDPVKKTSKVYIETGKVGNSSSGTRETSATSLSTKETSLTELLAQAKSKSTSRKSGGSVNSAPVNSSYVRRDGRRSDSRSTAEGGAAASVSDIIQNLDAAAKTTGTGSVKSAKERLKKRRQQKESDESDDAAESWLFDEVTGALGPRGIAADLESLSGRSHQSGGGRSHKSHRSNKSKRRSRRSSGESVNSRDSKRSSASRRSRSSRYSHRSTKSYISQMSEQSRSVANDLLRLEMQLAMVGQQQGQSNASGGNEESGKSANAPESGRRSRTTSSAAGRRSAASSARRSRVTVMAPPGKLGIILANKADSKGTVVSGVRTSSVLAEKISPGDRIVAIDGEDVSLMTVSEITTIMARKADYERTLTVLTTPRTNTNAESSSNKYRS